MEHYEMHCSPDSLSSGSSLEGILPLVDLGTWVESVLEKEISNITDTSEAVSSSVAEQEQDFAVPGNLDGNNSAPLHDPSTAPEKPKGKARVTFKESQLNALVRIFNQKRYLDPKEMKQLAEKTGLTYKQVKTWFQNRRRKFRKSPHPQHVNQGVPLYFQGEGQSPQQPPQQYNHMDIDLMRMGANNQAHYPHTGGNFATGPQLTFPNSLRMQPPQQYNHMDITLIRMDANNQAHCPDGGNFATGPQLTFPNSPRMLGWPMPPGNNHYEYNPVAVNPDMSVNNSGLHMF